MRDPLRDDVLEHTTDLPTDQDARSISHTILPFDQAADYLGISVNAVRMRVKRGTLTSRKTASGRVVVVLPTDPSPTPGRGRSPTNGATPDRPIPTDHRDQPPALELSPLADLIADLSRQNAELSVAAALWQERARSLETELLALRAGPIAGDSEHAAQDANLAPSRDERAAEASDTYKPASDSLALVWRQWWRRVRGG